MILLLAAFGGASSLAVSRAQSIQSMPPRVSVRLAVMTTNFFFIRVAPVEREFLSQSRSLQRHLDEVGHQLARVVRTAGKRADQADPELLHVAGQAGDGEHESLRGPTDFQRLRSVSRQRRL